MFDHFIDIEVRIARANSGQRFVRTESATRAPSDVILPEQRALGAGKLNQQFLHRDVGIDRRGGIHRGANLQAEAQCYNFAGSASSSTIRLSNRPAPPPSTPR